MLGKLFNLTSGPPAPAVPNQQGPAPPQPSPESIQEDTYTRSLLFPDTQALHANQDQVFPLSTTPVAPSSAQANAFDYENDIDLDTRDVRIIIMQDSLGSVNPSLLYDSHPGPSMAPAADRSPAATKTPQNPPRDLRRVPTAPRKGSLGQPARPLVIQPGSPQPKQGALDRRASIQTRNPSFAETEVQKAAREYREDLASFSSCIFANTEVMSYKGTQTKVHIIPSDHKISDVSSSYVGDGRGSMGRSSARASRLAHSFTSEATNLPLTSPTTPGRQTDRKKILVTRLFPINLPLDDPESPNPVVSNISEDAGGFPFPYSLDDAKGKKRKPMPKQKRTPMYAVAMVLQLPSGPSLPSNASKAAMRTSGSYGEQQDFFPSSYGSARRSGWTMVGGGYGYSNDLIESTLSNEPDDHMDIITQHWDVIMRALTHLQSVAATALFPMLKQADAAIVEPGQAAMAAQLGRTSSISSRRGSDASQIKPSKTNSKLVTLSPNCLMQDQKIGQEVTNVRSRIVSGLRAKRVVTGQGRWGPWREEARWVAKWAGGKEQGFFFFNLLTSFLATHQDWLQALSPPYFRKRHHQQQKGKGEEDNSLPSRTIIVANDKMASRRLIFLLAAFLPANQQLPSIRPHRGQTSASNMAAYGQSPPTYVVPILKEESLRRKINRRTGGRRSSHSRSFSIQSQATAKSTAGVPAQLAHLSMDPQGLRGNENTLSKPGNIPFASSDTGTRKTSAATTNTVMADAAVPHFSTLHRTDTRRSIRPESSSSTAADDLKRTLTRGESSRTSQTSLDGRGQHSRWGSVISGLWSTKRRDSTVAADMPVTQESPQASPSKTIKKDRLSQMVDEAHTAISGPSEQQPSQGQPDAPRRSEQRSFIETSELKARVPDPAGAYESPVKTSINNDDGVIDVDIQFPDFLASFETAVSSPSSSGYLSTPGLSGGLDSFEQFSRVAIDGDVPLNVAGWLQKFHPDFTLQAIPPQEDLLPQVREALMSEPTPSVSGSLALSSSQWPTERWVDVSTALVADTTTFSIKRLRYRRLIKNRGVGAGVMDPQRFSGGGSYLSAPPALMTPALSPYEQPIEDRIEEEELFTLDETLVDAIEKVIAVGNSSNSGGAASSIFNEGSKDSSTASSSRSASKSQRQRERSNSELSSVQQHAGISGAASGPSSSEFHEVPRAECKTVVLSALSGIVQDVTAEREREIQATADGASAFEVSIGAGSKESALRAAARAWLDSVETGDG